jgi:allantoin racemase
MVINPNTSESVTQHIREELERIMRADTQLTVVNPKHGPVSIESAYDEALAVPHVLELVRTAEEEGYDAVVLACFSDPGLDAARELSNIPVMGIGETTLHVAAMLGHRYSVTTTGPSRVAARDLQARIRNADQFYSSALAMDMSVLEMDAYPQETKKRILELAHRAIE